MGIAGLGLAWRAAVKPEHVSPAIGEWILAFAAAVFVVLLVLWFLRTAKFPNDVIAEHGSAVTASFFATLTISCSELAVGALPYSRVVALVVWVVAALGSLVILLYLFGYWIAHGIKDAELTPALFIPIVGNATAIYAAVPLGMSEVGWALLAIALPLWLAVGPLILYRLLVVEPRLPRRVAAQLAVLVAAPAVMSNAWFLLDGGVADPAFKLLAFNALFFAVLSARLWRIAWGEPFHVGMWGWTFAGAALAGAFVRAATADPSPLYQALAVITLAAATLVVGWCMYGTVAGWIGEVLLLQNGRSAS
jgi:tellurite resistance protein